MNEQKSELTHDEQIVLAMQIMAQRQQQRLIIIRDNDHHD